MSAAALPQLRGWQRRPLHRMAQRLASWSNASGCLRCLHALALTPFTPVLPRRSVGHLIPGASKAVCAITEDTMLPGETAYEGIEMEEQPGGCHGCLADCLCCHDWQQQPTSVLR